MSYERTPQHRARMSLALRGKKKTEAHKAALSRSAGGGSRIGQLNANYRHGEWHRNQQEKARVYNANKAALKHGAESTLTLDEWLSVLDEYDWRCAYCFGPFENLDHITELVRGGGNTRANVAPACRNCNTRKTGTSSNWVPHIASKLWPRVAEKLYA